MDPVRVRACDHKSSSPFVHNNILTITSRSLQALHHRSELAHIMADEASKVCNDDIASTNTPQNTFPFLELLPELRDEVYRFVVLNAEITIDDHRITVSHPLAKTSHQMRKELMPFIQRQGCRRFAILHAKVEDVLFNPLASFLNRYLPLNRISKPIINITLVLSRFKLIREQDLMSWFLVCWNAQRCCTLEPHYVVLTQSRYKCWHDLSTESCREQYVTARQTFSKHYNLLEALDSAYAVNAKNVSKKKKTK